MPPAHVTVYVLIAPLLLLDALVLLAVPQLEPLEPVALEPEVDQVPFELAHDASASATVVAPFEYQVSWP